MAAHQLPGIGLNGNFVDGQDNWGELMDDNLELLTVAVNTRVLGTVADSGSLPADPEHGDAYIQLSDGHIRSWDDPDEEWMNTTPQNGWRVFRDDTLEFYNWIDGQWVNDDTGPSLPAGGTTGQVLAKNSDEDGDAEWVDPAAASLPAGTTGHFLRKTADGVEFVAIRQVPAGGTTGQVVVKTDEGYAWADPEAAAEGGVWGVINTATGAILAGGGFSIVRETGSRYNVTFDDERPNANYGVLFGGTSGAGGTQPYVVDGSQTTEGFSIICYNNGGGEAAPGKLMFQIAGLLPGAEEGSGVPPGGTTGQVLAKLSDDDGDAGWADLPSGGGGGAGHTWWRVIWDSNFGDSFSGTRELIFLDEAGEVIPASGAVPVSSTGATSGGSFDGNPAMAFDGDNGTWWQANGSSGPWLGLHYADAQTIGGITIRDSNFPNQTLRTGRIQYSDDGAAWTDLFAIPEQEFYSVTTVMNPALDLTTKYRFGSFFTTAPSGSEVLMMHAVTDTFTLPADMDGSVWVTGTNPSGTVVFSLKVNGVEIGTISVTAGGAATFDSTETVIDAGDVISLVGPAAANGIANTCFTFRGYY